MWKKKPLMYPKVQLLWQCVNVKQVKSLITGQISYPHAFAIELKFMFNLQQWIPQTLIMYQCKKKEKYNQFACNNNNSINEINMKEWLVHTSIEVEKKD